MVWHNEAMDKPNPDLTEYGQTKEYARGDFLFLEGDAASGFFLVLEGLVRVYKMDATGREVEIARLGAGDYFGEAIV
ncbi:MAG: cyclic nucleotide-binding domain-containing protein, partial [Candidatus Aminicenantes bacterium]|nr:cyclic nucleotide-binding domain-containing protein [Candidatus Aminicenantes bacterium]